MAKTMSQINPEKPPNEDCQVFVGNLKVFISDDLLSVKFHPYGKIKKIHRLDPDFAFIEYGAPKSAELAEVECGSILAERKIFVKKVLKDGNKQDLNFEESKIESKFIPKKRPPLKDDAKRGNDIEIIVTADSVIPYAEKIEKFFLDLDIDIDILRPCKNVPQAKIYGALATRGTLFAIVIEPVNVEKNSVSYVDFESGNENKNQPIHEVYRKFYTKYVKIIGKMDDFPPRSHPDSIQYMIELLINNRTLTVNQYDDLIKHLESEKYATSKEQEQRSGQRKKNKSMEMEMDRYDGFRSRYRRGGGCYEYGSDSESEEEKDDKNLKDRQIEYDGRRVYKKNQKERNGDPVEILMHNLMLERIKRKVKRTRNLNDKDDKQRVSKVVDELTYNDRLKHAMDDLKGIKRMWY